MEQELAPKPKKTSTPLKIIIIALGLFVFLLAAFYAGYSVNSNNTNCPVLGLLGGGKNNSYQAGFDAARAKLEQSGLLRPEPAEIFTLSGKILTITQNKITLKADPTVANPLAEQAPEERTITITPDTKIIKQTAKSPDEFAAEFEKYRKDTANLKPDETPPAPPSAFTTEELKLSDLKAGDNISVTSGQNIKMAAQFTANEILLSVTPERPAPPAPPQP